MAVSWGEGWVEITPDSAGGNELSVELAMESAEVSGDCVSGWFVDAGRARISLSDVCTVRVDDAPAGDDDDDDDDDTGPGDDDDDTSPGDDDDDDDSGLCG